MGIQQFTEPEKVIRPRPDRHYEGQPQEDNTDGVKTHPEIWEMDQQRNDGGDLKSGFVFPQP